MAQCRQISSFFVTEASYDKEKQTNVKIRLSMQIILFHLRLQVIIFDYTCQHFFISILIITFLFLEFNNHLCYIPYNKQSQERMQYVSY